jgi:hypothetical protein
VHRTLIIACGALAREIIAVIKANGLTHLDLRCLPATLHNRPELIAGAVQEAIQKGRETHHQIFVAYADCGTGGALDAVLAEEGVARLPGPHCYATFAGQERFAALAEAAPGTFYLTDFLARQFDTLVIEGLGLDRHPELLPAYFGNYTRLVHLAQSDDPALTAAAEAAAERLGLAYERVATGLGELAAFITTAANGALDARPRDPLLARHPGPGDREGGTQDGQAPAARAVRAGHRPRRDARAAHRHRRLSGRVAKV